MKTLILALTTLAVASANPAANKEWHWISPMPKVSPNVREAPFVELAQLVASPRRLKPLTNGKPVLDCGISTPMNDESRIVGGVEASPHEFPWQVIIYIDDRYLCGGSLISDEWVLTAAACTTGASSIEIVMGAHDVSVNEPEQVIMTSTNIITHEDYGPILLRNNVGLVKLPQPVTLSDAIRPICLPALSDRDVGADVMLTMSGWGYNADGGDLPARLRKVSKPSISNADCTAVYGPTVVDETICTATAPGMQGICSGDDGGPLMLEDKKGIFYLRGVTSFMSSNGCENGSPDGSTRTKYYLDWININTGIAIEP